MERPGTHRKDRGGVLPLFLRFSGDSPQNLHVHLSLIGGWTWWDAEHQQLSGRPVDTVDSSKVRLRVGRGDAERSAELRGAITCTLEDEEGLDRAVADLAPDPLRGLAAAHAVDVVEDADVPPRPGLIGRAVADVR